MSVKRNSIHPYIFNMWLAVTGIVMFFAAFTSAYLVMHGRNSWKSFRLPDIFWFSTAIILVSSFTMHLAVKTFRAHYMAKYKKLITLTALLGILFLVCQGMGFYGLYGRNITLRWNQSASFLFIIVGAHMLHVLGGVIALLIILARAYRRRIRTYDVVPVKVAATYWHFVGGLWIYLYLFFIYLK